MDLLITTSVAIVAVLHVGFMLIEMLLWQRPQGRRIFGLSRDFAEQSASLAANQGLYNGFLAAGLVWGLVQDDGKSTLLFFLGCIVIAGIFGAITARPIIFWIQAVPAIITLILVMVI